MPLPPENPGADSSGAWAAEARKNKLIMWDPDRYGTTVPCEWEPGPAWWGLGARSRGCPGGQGWSSNGHLP